MKAYHATEITNIISILRNGLVPSIGKNSRSVHEHNFLTYFSTRESINKWIKTFDIGDSVILEFDVESFNNRVGYSQDYFTTDIINPSNIMIEGIKLDEYYKLHKEKIDSALEESIKLKIKEVSNNLNNLVDLGMNNDPWNIRSTDPNIVEVMDLLIKIRSFDNKKIIKKELDEIMIRVKEILISNDLGIDESSILLSSLYTIYEDVMSDNPMISLEILNYITTILSINMYYRQLSRFNEKGILFTDENRIWDFDRLPLREINKKIYENNIFIELLEETVSLKENQSIIKA